MSDDDDVFDVNVVREVVAQHGYKLVSATMTPFSLGVHVVAVVVVLFMLVEMRWHLTQLSRNKSD